jgi:AraC-like DNA-binding protein/predicted transcriptional regulator YdeE
MKNLDRIEKALEYIDGNLDEALRLEQLAKVFYFSPYYFHRVFTAVVGRPITAYMRERRLQKACMLLAQTRDSILSIGMDCGFETAQAFCRTFKNQLGVSPTQYRKEPCANKQVTVQELMDEFRHKLKGGIFVEPRIIERPQMYIAGVSGDGSKTAVLWQNFMEQSGKRKLASALSQDGYEVRICEEKGQTCHVGLNTSTPQDDDGYTVLPLPATLYASFDVYVAEGYDSQNTAMDEWLISNKNKYVQRLLNGKYYVVEYYDERFHGNESDSIVEIWVPIEEVKTS